MLFRFCFVVMCLFKKTFLHRQLSYFGWFMHAGVYVFNISMHLLNQASYVKVFQEEFL